MDFQGMKVNSGLKDALSAMVASNKMPHAIILEGSSAAGRMKLARLIAASLVCTSAGERPCMVCSACKKSFGSRRGEKKYAGDKLLSEKLNHPDISEIAKESDRVQFGINPIRIMRSEAFIMPNESDVKVYILSDAHLLNAQAQNALLKILEEPPAYICFILECSSSSILLQTVRSRSVVFNLGPPEKGEGISSKKMEKAAAAAANVASAVMAPKEYELLKSAAVFENDKVLLKLALPELELIFRDALVIKMGNSETMSVSPETAGLLAEAFPGEKLIKLIEETRKLQEAIERNANHNLLITLLSSRLKV